jgi:hypothetical protein
MSKRSANCDHAHWEILPNNVIRCNTCGEIVDEQDVIDWCSTEQEFHLTVSHPQEKPPKPLTYRLINLL